MNLGFLGVGLCLLTTALPLGAAEVPPPRPRPAPVISPDVQADRQVTFRLQAAKASEVSVAGQWPDGRAPMTKDTNGIWNVTVGPIEPGVWEYSFQVEGISMIDPGNPAIKPMRSPRTSILHLPGDPPLIHDFQDVPHGVVHQHTYRSKSLGRLRELAVYTPPGYDQKRNTRFPTLYLQHGSGDNQATWVTHGKAHWILDNLLAQGRAQPMVVVMMDGHAAVGGGSGGFTNNTALFEEDLLDDVMPFIEANYRVRTDNNGHAIVGLSMGGGQSLTIGLNNLHRFAWVGGFSSAVPSKETVARALDDPDATNRKLKLLWIAVGKEDFLRQRNEDFIAVLNDKHIRHEWHLTEGNHSWPVWRKYLADFAPKLFDPPSNVEADTAIEFDGYAGQPPVSMFIPLPHLSDSAVRGFRADIALPARDSYSKNRIKVLVGGRVVMPGQLQVPAGWTVLQAISCAGGFEDWAFTRRVRVARSRPRSSLELHLHMRRAPNPSIVLAWYGPPPEESSATSSAAPTDFALEDGDVVFVGDTM